MSIVQGKSIFPLIIMLIVVVVCNIRAYTYIRDYILQQRENVNFIGALFNIFFMMICSWLTFAIILNITVDQQKIERYKYLTDTMQSGYRYMNKNYELDGIRYRMEGETNYDMLQKGQAMDIKQDIQYNKWIK